MMKLNDPYLNYFCFYGLINNLPRLLLNLNIYIFYQFLFFNENNEFIFDQYPREEKLLQLRMQPK